MAASDIPYGTLDLMVLKTLEVMGSSHGYGIARRIEQIADGALALNQGTIYPALLRLEQKGWISSEWGVSENNRRARFYTITRAGRKQLTTETQNWTRTVSILERLLADGEEPLALLGAFSWQLRRLAQAGRLAIEGMSLPQALSEVGFGPWQIDQVEPQLRHRGRRRLEKLFDWLLEADLGMKGNSPLAPAVQLERLVVKLAQPRAERASR